MRARRDESRDGLLPVRRRERVAVDAVNIYYRIMAGLSYGYIKAIFARELVAAANRARGPEMFIVLTRWGFFERCVCLLVLCFTGATDLI